jgi:N-acetylglutamate synthase-like GNAT family acetyltransferase
MTTLPERVARADRRCVVPRRAGDVDARAVERSLASQSSPRDGVAEWLPLCWLAEHDGAAVGAAGIGPEGESALLRDVAVNPAWRGSGLGRLLTEQALEEARRLGAREVYLLTTMAEHDLGRLGFVSVGRDAAPVALTASSEFRGNCRASAVPLHCSGARGGPA